MAVRMFRICFQLAMWPEEVLTLRASVARGRALTYSGLLGREVPSMPDLALRLSVACAV
jgi:hypothetical protein